tara:strand:+ start:2453 stop:3151 length:699 start_codon:yes stop_codon:yes gene_type:complete
MKKKSYAAFVTSLLAAISRAPLSKESFAVESGIKLAMQTMPHGIFAQFGVYRGKTLKMLSKICGNDCHIFAFDSFEGLPEKWRAGKTASFEQKFTKKGAFGMGGHVPRLGLKNVAYSVGLFNQTLPSFFKSMSDKPASFLHIDGDLYVSARDVLCGFEEKNMLRNGTVIVFDELIGYPEYLAGELRAFFECVVQEKYSFRILERGARVVKEEYAHETWPQSVAIVLEGNREG